MNGTTVNSFLKRKKAKNDLANMADIPFTKGIPKFPPKFPKIPISPPISNANIR